MLHCVFLFPKKKHGDDVVALLRSSSLCVLRSSKILTARLPRSSFSSLQSQLLYSSVISFSHYCTRADCLPPDDHSCCIWEIISSENGHHELTIFCLSLFNSLVFLPRFAVVVPFRNASSDSALSINSTIATQPTCPTTGRPQRGFRGSAVPWAGSRRGPRPLCVTRRGRPRAKGPVSQ